jgi:Na+/citrate or Na+/malate symporter
LFPFCYLLSYRSKLDHARARFIAWWILVMLFVDVAFNTLPAIKDATGQPRPFFSSVLIWQLTALVGVGGICVWAYLRSFATTKLIPIHDPRIVECLTHHESSA